MATAHTETSLTIDWFFFFLTGFRALSEEVFCLGWERGRKASFLFIIMFIPFCLDTFSSAVAERSEMTMKKKNCFLYSFLFVLFSLPV